MVHNVKSTKTTFPNNTQDAVICKNDDSAIMFELDTHHGLEGDVALFDEGRLALLLRHGRVIRDIGHVTLFLVTMRTFDGAIVNGLLNL